jgi:hypothetical protein
MDALIVPEPPDSLRSAATRRIIDASVGECVTVTER